MICWIQSANNYDVSIRASLQQRGELYDDRPWVEVLIVSIRASLQQRGEPPVMARNHVCRTVSIRASLQQRGEHSSLYANKQVICFNPRLTSAARRTSAGAITAASCGSFQSAPHFSSEANPKFARASFSAPAFQSAPHFSSEANSNVYEVQDVILLFQSAPHFSSEANTQLGEGWI